MTSVALSRDLNAALLLIIKYQQMFCQKIEKGNGAYFLFL